MTASEQITTEVTSWPGVSAGPGSRGEFAFTIGRKQIGHLHGDRWAPGQAGRFALSEQREVRLAVAAQHGEVELDALDPARLGQHARLRLDHLRGQDAAAAPEAGLLAD